MNKFQHVTSSLALALGGLALVACSAETPAPSKPAEPAHTESTEAGELMTVSLVLPGMT